MRNVKSQLADARSVEPVTELDKTAAAADAIGERPPCEVVTVKYCWNPTVDVTVGTYTCVLQTLLLRFGSQCTDHESESRAERPRVDCVMT